MSRSWLEGFLPSRVTLWAVALFTLGLFLFSNLPWQLDDYDQAKQAFTSFEMIQEGAWFYQTTPHQHIATKPPLVGWISAGLFAATRQWELAWRLPSLLSAGWIAILLFRFGRSAYGSLPGFLAAAAFGLNLLTPRLATLVRTDMPLALIIFLIGSLIWQRIRRKETWTSGDRLTLFVLLTVGMLIKGPVVYAFLLPGIALFNWRHRKDRLSAWPGWWPWIASLVIFLIWVAGGIRFMPGFYEEVVLREFLGRFGGEIHRAQPWFFYLPHVLHKFAPWSILLIALIISRIRFREASAEPGASASSLSPETFWLVAWSLGGLILMSLLPSKRVDRIFPVIPPLCLLLAGQVSAGLKTGRLRTRVIRWSGATLVLALAFAGGYAAWKVGSGYIDHRDVLAGFGKMVRQEAIAHGWRYEAVSTVDEGLLLYLQKTHFISAAEAETEWNMSKLDALVVRASEAPTLMSRLNESSLSTLRSGSETNGGIVPCVLITRTKQ